MDKTGGNRFSVPGYQTSSKNVQQSGYAPIGLQANDATVTTNRRWIIGLVVFGVIVAVFAAVAFTYAMQDRFVQVDEDSLRNKLESKNVEIFLQNGDPSFGESTGTICSGVFIRPTGEILTAAHCFYTQDPDSCDFVLTPTPHYPTTIETLTVEIMSVNGTSDKYTFTAQIVAWSGITDVAIIKPLPLIRSDGSVINVVNQQYFEFASDTPERGETVAAFGYDLAFYKKAYRQGQIKHPRLDIGTLVAASTEQIFVEAFANQGASGSGWYDQNEHLTIAPLSFTWSFYNQYEVPDSTNFFGGLGSSGTAFRITKPLVNRMLNPATPANGLNGEYLVPTLGIVALGPVDAVNLWLSYNPDLYPLTENKGVMFKFLASQEYFNTTAGCGQVFTPHAVPWHSRMLSMTFTCTMSHDIHPHNVPRHSRILSMAFTRTMSHGIHPHNIPWHSHNNPT